MRLYHRTESSYAATILAHGFADGAGMDMTVWLSDRPLDINEGAHGDAILLVELPEEEIVEFEWVEDEKPYREWLIPAQIVNRSQVRIVEEDEYLEWPLE